MAAGARGALRRCCRLVATTASFALVAILPDLAQAARLVSATGAQQGNYGRIILTFDAPMTVKPKLSGAVLILSFPEAVTAGPEKIASGMPDYVSVVRRDPDGTALRLALQRPYRVNVQQAGEQVYLDLLPESWAGLPPPLPLEVVAELARRAREAEAALKARAPAPAARILPLELSITPTRTRVSLKLPTEARSLFEDVGSTTRLSLPGAWRIDEQGARGRLRPEIGRIAVENGNDGARLLATPADGMLVLAERDGDSVAIDFLPKKPLQAEGKADPTKTEPANGDATKSSADMRPAPVEEAPQRAAEAGAKRSEPAASDIPKRRAGSGLVFPFASRVRAALFERAGLATLVFETAETVAAPPAGATGLVAIGAPRRVGGFVVLRFAIPAGKLVDLTPITEPQGWEMTAGDAPAPSDSLVAQRKADPGGKIGISISLPDPGGSVWLDLDGERIAVVTAGGNRRAGMSKPQRFVDFELLTSRVGAAVLALADDVAVRPEVDGVAVRRESGLALSGVVREAEPAVAPASDLVIERSAWEAARLGDVGTSLRNRFNAVVATERRDRGPARLALAKALMANGLNVEALGALGAAAAEDTVIESDPQTKLLRGILAARMGRIADAEALLSAETVLRNPEARLWRGLLRVEAGRWTQADADLRAGAAALERYPDDLAAIFRVALAQTAAELTDWDAAAKLVKSAGPGTSPLVRDNLLLLRARVDEARSGHAAALEGYETLAEKGEQPVAAAASLRATLLSLADGKITQAEATERLESLALMWHGGATEAETLSALGRLYEQAGKWKQVFVTAQRANAIAPDAPSTRSLHDAAKSLFEDLFLGERADTLGGIEALSLYFDYKDFAPTGRRADDIVRKLADRLVALDLLDSADELLGHQIEHRLTGPARASVAARLASIRLMESKPLEALQVLDATHLPELSEDVRRARALLRARALSDLTRTDMALETIEGESGPDAERLRADILWAARRWREAGEAHEAILGEAWRSGKPLNEVARADVIRAGVAYGLAGEILGLERLKAKFAPAMAESEDARTFALLTRADATRNPAFRDIARRATTAETLAAFLGEYRKRYPQMSTPERGSAAGDRRADSEATATPPG